jgi:MoxR-like ATPase
MTARDAIQELQQRMNASILGQEQVVERLILALLCNGNALLEGLPGLAKTRAVRSLAENLAAQLSRIQFTPDLLPADITGAEMYLGEQAEERFVFQPGPIFSNLVLADEINRAPAKVQAALLEAMEERQVTVAGKTHKMPELFMVLATQNPVEQEGTYPLPEAQMDRFLMHISMDYPSDDTEQEIIRLVRKELEQASRDSAVNSEQSTVNRGDAKPTPLSQRDVFAARAQIVSIKTPGPVERYIVDIVGATRRPEKYGEDLGRWIQVGVSPRGSLALDKTSRAHAWLEGRDTVTPDDVRAVTHDCLRHRITLSYEANADGVTPDQAITDIVKQVALA